MDGDDDDDDDEDEDEDEDEDGDDDDDDFLNYFSALLGLGSVMVGFAPLFDEISTASCSKRSHGELFCVIFRGILGILGIF